ncbi:MAG: PQQ-binding-like beta-propeller repeat protein [Candidatus Thalassarchaeaceae archaeon]
MTGLSIESISSYVRDLSSSCSALLLVEDLLFAGSHDGLLVSWDASSGVERWRVSIDGPISDFSLDLDTLFVTSSDSLYSIDVSDGSILWNRELEGASDYVVALDGIVWATSSVYELEVADFIENTVWRFDADGKELERWDISEKPWHIGLDKEGSLLLGIGLPRCGVAKISSGEKRLQFILKPLSTYENGYDIRRSPVTCGDCSADFFYAPGPYSKSPEEENWVWENDPQLTKRLSFGVTGSDVTAVKSTGFGFVYGTSTGFYYYSGCEGTGAITKDGLVIQGNRTDLVKINGSIDAVAGLGTSIWLSYYDSRDSRPSHQHKIGLFREITQDDTYRENGKHHFIPHDSRIRLMDSSDDILVMGDEQGRVFVIESEVAQRRIDFPSFSEPRNDPKESELRARLRMLRNR